MCNYIYLYTSHVLTALVNDVLWPGTRFCDEQQGSTTSRLVGTNAFLHFHSSEVASNPTDVQ